MGRLRPFVDHLDPRPFNCALSFSTLLNYVPPALSSQASPAAMSSYDPIPPDGVISQEQFRASMKLVRLQIAVPISVLASISANIVCALAIKPGLRKS